MITKTLSKLIIFFFCFLLPYTAYSAEEGKSLKEYLEEANGYIKSYRHFEACDALKEATKLGGAKHPSLHMRLGILYYGLGLIPEAIAEGEKAVNLAPSSKWYKYDLAKFYYVDKQFEKAEEQFTSLLKLDPGFTLGYYYLAELYFQKREYDMAWLSLQRSILLGHKGKHLIEKLSPHTSKPVENFKDSTEKNQLFRFIKLSSAEEAQNVLAQIDNGKLFENLELELSKDQAESADFGVMLSSELKATVSASLRNTRPYSSPVIIQTGPDFRVMQKIAPFEITAWRSIIADKLNGPATVKQQTKPEVTDEIARNQTIETKNADQQPKVSNRLAAFYALESWKEAWESQDFKYYLRSYSENFTPDKGSSLEQWRKKRKRSLTRPQYIRITIEEPVVETLSNHQLLITFKQSYESNTYQDTVIKTLTMDKEANGWKITQEREIQKL